jgi:hypothetical protein
VNKDPIDWDRVGELARAAYLADHTVVDGNDFEAGYMAAVRALSEQISLGYAWQVDDPRLNYVDVQVDKEFYRLLHRTQ